MKLSNFGIHITGKCKDSIVKLMKEMVTQKGLKKIITFFQIFDELIENREYTILCESDYVPSTCCKKDLKLQAIYQYLFENYSEEVSINIIAQKMGMSESAFCHFLRKYNDCSFSQKLTQMRVNQACHYLSNTELSITHICYECGFKAFPILTKLLSK